MYNLLQVPPGIPSRMPPGFIPHGVVPGPDGKPTGMPGLPGRLPPPSGLPPSGLPPAGFPTSALPHSGIMPPVVMPPIAMPGGPPAGNLKNNCILLSLYYSGAEDHPQVIRTRIVKRVSGTGTGRNGTRF